jgi:IS6 family transposase
VQRFTPLLADAARPCRHLVGDRWQVDETYVKVAARLRYVYRAIDQVGQVIDVFVSARRDTQGARRFFGQAVNATKLTPVGHARRGHHRSGAGLPGHAGGAAASGMHRTDQYANNGIECDHGRLKARLRLMRGLKQDRSARVIVAGHAFIQNVRHGHYELAVEEPANRRVAVAVDKLAL